MFEDYSGPSDETVPFTPPSGQLPFPTPAVPAVPVKKIGPEQLIRRSTTVPEGSPLAKIGYLWRSDPAYKVLMIAIAVIILSGIVGLVLIGNLLASGGPSGQPSSSGAPSAVAPNATPTPTATSQPTATPTPTPTPVQNTPTPTEVVQPTPTPTPVANAPLSVQIVNVPSQVKNGTTVPVTVSASQPGVTIRLLITYSTLGSYFNRSMQADSAGNATFSWSVQVYTKTTASAHLIAVAQDQSGHVAQSQPVTVQVMH
ncbi:MAG TPA: hypothetical protein VKX46_05445 [Ktedonobacteraceae bacterium]|nr:hypothetical protein [Ktedonobacteraceae bacterium]